MAQMYGSHISLLNGTCAPNAPGGTNTPGELRPPPTQNGRGNANVARSSGIHDEQRLLNLWTRLNSGEELRASPGEDEKKPDHDPAYMKIMELNRQAVSSSIVDADISLEMTTFINNKILAQASVATLSQGAALPRAALSLVF